MAAACRDDDKVHDVVRVQSICVALLAVIDD
jgi:hypothetical protein